MDPLSWLLSSVRSRDGVLHQTMLAAPFALRVEETAPLAIALSPTSDLELRFDDGTTHHLPRGQVALIATPAPYVLADVAGTPVRYTVDEVGARDARGVRLPPPTDDVRCLVEPGGQALIVSGIYAVSAGVGPRLLRALPDVAIINLPGRVPLLALLEEHLAEGVRGRQALLDRWLDHVLVSALRAWFADVDRAPGWFLALDDPVVGPALAAVHDHPERAWTTVDLAGLAHASRSAFAARFTRLVGEPPLGYLTALRMDLATAQLVGGDKPLEAIASAVGYASPFALSAAYKRHTGVSPAQVRRRAA